MKSFLSKETILELLTSSALSTVQIDREYERIVKLTNHDVNNIDIVQTTDKVNFITTQARNMIDNTDLHICKDFSSDICDLKKSIDILTTRMGFANHGHSHDVSRDTLSEVQPDPVDSAIPATTVPLPGSLATPTTTTSDINGIYRPFELLINSRNDELDYLLKSPHVPYLKYSNCTNFLGNDYLKKLNEQVNFNFKLNGRELAYYGEHDYRYTGARHSARPISDSPVLADISKQVADLFPSFNFNSVLVSRYSNGSIRCPPHSDDELDIAEDSLILTLSFGAKRTMCVRKKMEFASDEFGLAAGDVLFMSKASQLNFDHAIPHLAGDVGERVSCTFRLIKPSSRPFNRNNSNIRTKAPLHETKHDPKKILILSDSKNLGFDPSEFRSPSIACFKEACYSLADIRDHEDKIALADVILISAGVNDILRGENAFDIFLKLRLLMEHYNRTFPEKMFMFYAVSEVTGKYYMYNEVINELNDFCFHMSLRLSTFKLFNNLFFNTYTHLASDGLHLSKFGKWSASVIWTQAVLCILGIRKAALPLRPRYLEFRDEFLARSSPAWAG